jgi:hypothetical protein
MAKNDAQKTIRAAMSYDMSAVMDRYAEATRLPAGTLSEHEREIKRFLAMSALNPGKYGMRGPLDELWHTFILFTSSYATFCRRLGGGFIHHLPETPKTKSKQRRRTQTSYASFLSDYRRLFKETPPVHLWPRPGGPVMDPSCNKCGQFCSQTCVAMELKPPQQRF